MNPRVAFWRRSANIPGLPPVKLDVAGNRYARRVRSNADLQRGDTIGAAGQANLQRQGAVRRLCSISMRRSRDFFPARGRTRFCGNDGTRWRDDLRAMTAPSPFLNCPSCRERPGSMRPAAWMSNRAVDLRLSARAVPTDRQKTVAGDAEIKTLAFTGTVKGQLSAPESRGATLGGRRQVSRRVGSEISRPVFGGAERRALGQLRRASPSWPTRRQRASRLRSRARPCCRRSDVARHSRDRFSGWLGGSGDGASFSPSMDAR